MTENLTKHAYVDDYPYICYAPEADMNISDASGGGGDLPIASANTLGGVKIGEGLNITSEGVLSSSGGGGANVLLINSVDGTLDQKSKTIYDAYIGGTQCLIVTDEDTVIYNESLTNIEKYPVEADNEYVLSTVQNRYEASSDNDYPVRED